MVTTPNSSAASGRHSFAMIGNTEQIEPGIRVTELGHVDRIMWEANILHGMGRHEEVKSMADAAKEKGSDAGYQLAIALLRMEGNKDMFEDIAVEYAVQTGNSPPVWLESHAVQKKTDSAPKRMSLKIGSLMMESIIETTIKMESPWPIELDFSAVTKMDVAGLDIFQESLAGRISREEGTKLIGVEKILKNVTEKIKMAPVDGNLGLWTFCFNALKLLGLKSQFDELSADFVEKTGEDMPAWKDLRDEDDINPVEATKPPISFGHPLGDSLSIVSPALLTSLSGSKAYKEARENKMPFALDFSNVKRWTIHDVSGVISFLHQGIKEQASFEFINLNEMLLALLKGFGVEKRARLVVAGETI